MGNCWGSQSSSSPTGQANNLNAKRSKREEAWAATGSVSLRDSNLKVAAKQIIDSIVCSTGLRGAGLNHQIVLS